MASSNAVNPNMEGEELLHMANGILVHFGRDPYVKELSDCNHVYFVEVYEAMLGESLPGLTHAPQQLEGMIHNIQVVIDTLASDVLGIDISHVSAQMVMNQDMEHIRCLLEIFHGLLEFMLEEVTQDIQEEMRQEAGDKPAINQSADSDKLDDDHEILSDVMSQEFGPTYQNKESHCKERVAKKSIPSSKPYPTNNTSGESITWKSGNNINTVAWTNSPLRGPPSPSGDSTATDELINLAQSTGNSTDELIREAQYIQKGFDASQSSYFVPCRKGRTYEDGENTMKFDESVPFTSHLSSILSSTQAIEKEIVGQPKKKSAFTIEKQNINDGIANKPGISLEKPVQTNVPLLHLASDHSNDILCDNPEMTKDSLQSTQVSEFDQTYSINNSTALNEVSGGSPPVKLSKTVKASKSNRKVTPPKKTRPKKPTSDPRKKRPVSKKKVISQEPVKCNGVDEKTSNGPKGVQTDAVKKSAVLPAKSKLINEDVGISQVEIVKDRTAKNHLENLTKTEVKETATQTSGESCVEETLAQQKSESTESKKISNTQEATDISSKQPSTEILPVTETKDREDEKEKPVPLLPYKTLKIQSNLSIPDTSKASTLPSKIQTNLSIPDPSNDSSLPSKIQTNLSIPDTSTDSRSKTLTDLGERLKKLREQVHPHIPHSNTVHETQETNNVQETEESNNFKVNIEKKEKAKVSFNMDSLLEEYHYSMSDTEVDYVSPMNKPTVRKEKSRVGTNKEPAKKNHVSRSILSSKNNQSSSSSGTNEVTSCDTTNISDKFDEHRLKRDGRLRKLKKELKTEAKENKLDVDRLRSRYSKHHEKLKDQEKVVKKQSNLLTKERKAKEKIMDQFNTTSSLVNKSPGLKKVPIDKYAAKLSAIYRKGSPKKSADIGQGTKRSASSSPVGRRRYKTPLVLEENEILPVMEDEFPFIHLSPHTAKLMWQKQLRQVSNLSKHTKPHKTSKIQRAIADAQQKQKALAEVMKKEIEHNRRLKELKERKEEDTIVKRNLHERRQRSARARRYYNEYAVQNKSRMLKKRTKEEKIFRQLFEDGLEIQKQRIKEMRDYAREQKEKNAKKQKDEIESLENYYKDKFACLAESVAEEKYELKVRQKAQAHILDKMRRGMRKRMEKDLRDIQDQLQNDDDAYYFRQLDADVMKKEFQLATYKASK